MLKPTDVTCPWAILTMAVLQSIGKRKTKVNPYEFDLSESRMTIEPIQAWEPPKPVETLGARQ